MSNSTVAFCHFSQLPSPALVHFPRRANFISDKRIVRIKRAFTFPVWPHIFHCLKKKQQGKQQATKQRSFHFQTKWGEVKSRVRRGDLRLTSGNGINSALFRRLQSLKLSQLINEINVHKEAHTFYLRDVWLDSCVWVILLSRGRSLAQCCAWFSLWLWLLNLWAFSVWTEMKTTVIKCFARFWG